MPAVFLTGKFRMKPPTPPSPHPTPATPASRPSLSDAYGLRSPGDRGWRDLWFEIIFEADTFYGKLFDLLLLLLIAFNLVVICLESVSPWDQAQYQYLWWTAEWTCTVLFTLEYAMRIACVRRPWRYIFSFYGIVDLLSILPMYLALLIGVPAQSFAVVRSLRLLRVFRVLNLSWLTHESDDLFRAVWHSRAKIVVFVFVVIVSVTIAGTLMYEIEGRNGPATSDGTRQFDSIPSSIYWAIVTMTTVGYGDIVPKTALGKAVSSVLILLGYSLIIVPTGFVSSEFGKKIPKGSASQLRCPLCTTAAHDADARFCKWCGQRLERSLSE